MSIGIKARVLKGVVLGIAMLFFGSISVDAAKKSSVDEMEITQTGVLMKYTDTNKEKHDVVIPEEVVQIADEAFSGCEKITEIKFEKPDKIKSIGKNAFSGCTSLKTFTLPKNITELENNTFNGCKSLKEIKFSKGLKVIGENCFGGCTSLTKLNLPDKLEILSSGVFSNCNKLEKVKFPKSLTYIGEQAFSGCTSLKIKDGKLPESLVAIGAKAFQNCTSLEKIVLYSNLGKYSLENGAFSGLGYDCFSGCENLKTVIFKNAKSKLTKKSYFTEEAGGVRELSPGLFSNCKKLKTIVIENFFIEKIDDSIFNGCNGTITIKAPQWVIDKSIKSFVESYRQNNVTLKYKSTN